MKKLCLSSIIIFSIVGVQLILIHSNVFADIGPYIPGGIIITGDKTDMIEMINEKVIFDVKKQNEDSPFGHYGYEHYAHVTAEFDMKNVTSSDETMQLIFPIPSSRVSYDDDWRDYFDPNSTSNPGLNFKVVVDGKNENFAYDLYNPYSNVSFEVLSIKFQVTFEAKAVTKIIIEYDTQVNIFDHGMNRVFEYIMETGSHWKGSIGSGEIIFNFPGDLINTLFFEYNDEFTLSGNQLIWQFSDLEPDEGHNIMVSYSPILLDIWGDRESYLENIVSNKEKGILKWDYDFFDDSYYKTDYKWGYPVEGNPIYLILPHPEDAQNYSSSLEGFWLASLGDNKTPWVHYEFDAVYEVDAMKITSGVIQEMEGQTYQIVSRPRKIKLVFSDGTSKKFELEDKPGEEILVEFDKVETSSIRVEALSSYSDYKQEDKQLGIEVVNFNVGKKVWEKEPSLGINFPEEFLAENSTTTRIDTMTLEEFKSVENFTLEVVSKNKVVFHDSLDLTSSETLVKFRELSGYMDFSTIGKISIDTDFLKMLNIDATVTMYGLTFEERPIIYKDGKVVTKDEVSNIEYDKESGTLSFDVEAFSIYEAKASDKEKKTDKVEDRSRSIDPSNDGKNPTKDFPLLLLLTIIAVVTIGGISIVLIYRRKEINFALIKTKLGFKSKKKEEIGFSEGKESSANT